MYHLVGKSMLYCKVPGDKTTEEEVKIIGVQEDCSGVTIYIPSLNRERDTLLSRLTPVEQTVDNKLLEMVKEIFRPRDLSDPIDKEIDNIVYETLTTIAKNVSETSKKQNEINKLNEDVNKLTKYCDESVDTGLLLFSDMDKLRKEVGLLRNQINDVSNSMKQEIHDLKSEVAVLRKQKNEDPMTPLLQLAQQFLEKRNNPK
jgi:uncharacterized coiled-coil DUF342 family protein